MNTFDTNTLMRLKACEQERLYYHTHEQYRKNKKNNDNERYKKQNRKHPEYRRYSNEHSYLFHLKKN